MSRSVNGRSCGRSSRRQSAVLAAILFVVATLVSGLLTGFPQFASPASAVPLSPPLEAVACPTVSDCIAVGGGGSVLVSRNGGLTWLSQPVPSMHFLYGIACPTTTRCIAVGDAGTVLVSDSEFSTWNQVPTGTAEPLSSVACPGDGHCYAVGDAGVVLATGDDGASWQRDELGMAVVDGVACDSSLRCVAVTSNSQQEFLTSDGTSWSAASVQLEPLLSLTPTNAVSCSPTICVGVGSYGLRARSTDSGAAWSFDGPGATPPGAWWAAEDLYGVTCAIGDRCLAVGAAGTILTSEDGGEKWTRDNSPTQETLLGVECPRAGSCLAVGDGGTIITTTDGGANWVVRRGTSPPEARISVLVVGDSLAHTIALYVGRDSSAYGVILNDGGLDGCDLARGDTLSTSGAVTPAAPACASTGPGWTAIYREDIAQDRPKVSLVVLGPWDLESRLINGKWQSPGQPSFDAYYRGQVLAAARILSAEGGRVAIATMPEVETSGPEMCAPPPSVVPNCPTVSQRVSALNAVAREVTREYPRRVTLIDLGQRLSPNGQFRSTADGVVIRAADGVHLSEPGGDWLAPWLLPLVVSVDR
jgi:photosystem II stability/assembly factor-like uncharacterized protein